MVLLRSHKVKLLFLASIITFFLSPIASIAPAQQQKEALGELKIEGHYISELVLCRKDGHVETLTTPNEELGEIVKLPIGEYRLQNIRLRGGYIYSGRSTSLYDKSDWVTVIEDEPVVFKVGAPLKQTVKVERQGPILKFSYNLTGVGGETYTVTRVARPAFTVFKGDKKLATGDFEFG